jgi:hypothetical protein
MAVICRIGDKSCKKYSQAKFCKECVECILEEYGEDHVEKLKYEKMIRNGKINNCVK